MSPLLKRKKEKDIGDLLSDFDTFLEEIKRDFADIVDEVSSVKEKLEAIEDSVNFLSKERGRDADSQF